MEGNHERLDEGLQVSMFFCSIDRTNKKAQRFHTPGLIAQIYVLGLLTAGKG